MDLSEKQKNIKIKLMSDRVTFVMRPLTTASHSACEAIARKRLHNLRDDIDSVVKAGFLESPDVDFDDQEMMSGLFFQFMIQELAVRHMISWDGVALDGDDAPCEPKYIRAAVSKHPLGQQFFDRFMLKQVEFFAAKKDFANGPNGTTSPAAE